jgi:hypothetical protein
MREARIPPFTAGAAGGKDGAVGGHRRNTRLRAIPPYAPYAATL